VLWKGHCAVHQRFLPATSTQVRAKYPGIQVIVHPECRWEVCQKADALGSTERLIKIVEDAPAGSMFAIGTEIHLVNRLARRFARKGKRIITLDDTGCLCTTMYRISPQHLAWALENLVEGRVVNRIQVRPGVKHWARVALGSHAGPSFRRILLSGISMKTFTLEEAQSLLPVLESLLKRAIEGKQAAEQVESGLAELARRIYVSGGMRVDVAAWPRQRAEMEATCSACARASPRSIRSACR
jgi:hypothetical protein